MKKTITSILILIMAMSLLPAAAQPRRSVTVGGKPKTEMNEGSKSTAPKKSGTFVMDGSGKAVPYGTDPYTRTAPANDGDAVFPTDASGNPVVMLDAEALLEVLLQLQAGKSAESSLPPSGTAGEITERTPSEEEPVTENDVPQYAVAPASLNDIAPEDLDWLISQLLAEKEGREGEKPEEEKKWWEKDIEKPMFSYDLFARAFMNQDTNFGLGGGLSMGVQTDSFRFELYGLADYFMKPIGGSGGAASLELMVEAGTTFAWKFMEAWRTRTYVELDFGYYAQLVQIPQQPGETFLAYNGIMMRPKIVTHLQILKHWDLSMGLFYQVPLYPVYEPYNGLGIIFGIL